MINHLAGEFELHLLQLCEDSRTVVASFQAANRNTQKNLYKKKIYMQKC